MSALVYPASLPCPQRMPFSRTERRGKSDLPGQRRARTLWRDRHGVAPVQFLLTFEQVAIWLAWFETEQLQGGAWFAATWRVPFGRNGVFRFIEAPSYPEFVPLVGWRVTASVEIRGRGMAPQSHVATLSYQALVAASLPLVYWKLDDAEGSTVGVDSGSLGLPLAIDPALTELETPALIPDGSAITITGASANPCIAAHNAALNFGSGDFTFAALLKADAPPADQAIIIAQGQTNSTFANWAFTVESSGGIMLSLYHANSGGALIPFGGSVDVCDGDAHFVVARRTGNFITLRVDGATVGGGGYALALWNSSSVVGMGCGPWTAGADPRLGLFPGVLDEVTIWNRALSDAELNAFYWAI